MRDRLIAWLLWGLARLGHDLAVRVIEAETALLTVRDEAERLHAQASARKARHAVVQSVITRLWPEAVRLSTVKQGQSFKRNQLYATAKKQCPRVDDDLCALAAAYALYYVNQERATHDKTLSPSREDV